MINNNIYSKKIDKLKLVPSVEKEFYGHFSIGENNTKLNELIDSYSRGDDKLQKSDRFAEFFKIFIRPWFNYQDTFRKPEPF